MHPEPSELDTTLSTAIIGHELERLCLEGIECINAGDFDLSTTAGQELLDRTAPDFEAVFNASPGRVGLKQANEIVKAHFTANPKDKYRVQDISSTVDLKQNNALVYMDMILEGGGTGATVNIMFVTRWSKNDKGRWLRRGYRGMRNMAWQRVDLVESAEAV